jgi:hypothetical protein
MVASGDWSPKIVANIPVAEEHASNIEALGFATGFRLELRLSAYVAQ